MGKKFTQEKAHDLAFEKAPYFLPSVPYQGSQINWPGVCLACGQPVSPRLNNLQQGVGACGYCGEKKVDTAIAIGKMMAKDLLPLDDFPGTKPKWRSKCMTCGDEVSPRFDDIRNGDGGCEPCGRNRMRATVSFSDAEARQQAYDYAPRFSPNVPYERAVKPWAGLCWDCGQPVSPSLNSLQQGGHHCVYCAEQQHDSAIVIGKAMAVGLTPLEPYKSVHDPWKCECTAGHLVKPRFNSIKNGGGCVECGRIARGAKKTKKTQDQVRDICEEEGVTVRGFDMRLNSANEYKSWLLATCPDGHDFDVSTNGFLSQGSRCTCGVIYGIRYTEPGYFYVVTSDEIVKCGIANAHRINARLTEHNNAFGLDQLLAKVYFEVTYDAKAREDLWREFVAASPHRMGTKREYVYYHDEAVSFALSLARGTYLRDAA